MDTAGNHADPSHPSRAAACPAPRSTTSLRFGQRTRERPDTGQPHRTPDAQTPAPDTGRVDRHAWTLDARTGDWTPNASRGRGHGDKGTAGIRTSGAHHAERPRAGTPKLFLWTAPAALGSPCWLGVRPPASATLPLALPGSCSVAPRPSRASAHCSPRTNFWSSVERTAKRHPLWQALL